MGHVLILAMPRQPHCASDDQGGTLAEGRKEKRTAKQGRVWSPQAGDASSGVGTESFTTIYSMLPFINAKSV